MKILITAGLIGGAGRCNRVRTKLNTELCRSQHYSIPTADASSRAARGPTAGATTRASTRSTDNASADLEPAAGVRLRLQEARGSPREA